MSRKKKLAHDVENRVVCHDILAALIEKSDLTEIDMKNLFGAKNSKLMMDGKGYKITAREYASMTADLIYHRLKRA